jgi:hypothetical protein
MDACARRDWCSPAHLEHVLETALHLQRHVCATQKQFRPVLAAQIISEVISSTVLSQMISDIQIFARDRSTGANSYSAGLQANSGVQM